MRKIALLCLLFTLALNSQAAAEPLQVAVSIPPQKYFAQKLGGPLLNVLTLVEKGDAHTYEPKPRQMAALSRAALYFALGLEFERPWIPRFRATNPKLRVVPVDAGIEKLSVSLSMAGDGAAAHGHATAAQTGNKHGRPGDLDPHIWLSPARVKIQARTMAEALCLADPEHEPEYQGNLAAFLAEIDELDRQIRALLAPLPPERRNFLVFHPSWGYFARDYDLRQLTIEVRGKEPSPGELGRVIAAARQAAISTVFVQPQMSAKSARTIAASIKARVVQLDPLAEEWSRNLLDAARAFQLALAPGTDQP